MGHLFDFLDFWLLYLHVNQKSDDDDIWSTDGFKKHTVATLNISMLQSEWEHLYAFIFTLFLQKCTVVQSSVKTCTVVQSSR